MGAQGSLKILYIVPYFVPAYRFGGPVRGSYEIGKRLAKKGHDVCVCTNDVYEPQSRVKAKKDSIDGMEVRYFPNVSNRMAARSKIFSPIGLRGYLQKNMQNYDLVHIQEYYTIMTPIAYRYCRKYSKPYLVSVRGVMSPVPRKSRSTMKKVFDKSFGHVIKNADAVVVQTEMEKRDCEKKGISRLRIIPNGIDLKEFVLPGRNLFRRRHGLQKGDIAILFVGRINQIKGLKYLVKAFQEIDNIKLHLFLVGPDDNYLDELKKNINSSRIHVLGALYGEEKMQALAGCDIFALPSIYDCSPNSMLEACAAGLPIVTTDANGLAGLVKAGAGVLARAGDADGLRSGIHMLMDAQLRKKMGAAGHRLVKSFSWDNITGQLEKLYREVLDVRH